MRVRDPAPTAIVHQDERDGPALRFVAAAPLEEPGRRHENDRAIGVCRCRFEPKPAAPIDAARHESEAAMMLAKRFEPRDETGSLRGKVSHAGIANEERVHAVEVEAIPHLDPCLDFARAVEIADRRGGRKACAAWRAIVGRGPTERSFGTAACSARGGLGMLRSLTCAGGKSQHRDESHRKSNSKHVGEATT